MIIANEIIVTATPMANRALRATGEPLDQAKVINGELLLLVVLLLSAMRLSTMRLSSLLRRVLHFASRASGEPLCQVEMVHVRLLMIAYKGKYD